MCRTTNMNTFGWLHVIQYPSNFLETGLRYVTQKLNKYQVNIYVISESFQIPNTIWISPNRIKYCCIGEFWLQYTICPIWIDLKSPPIYSLSVLCNLLQNFHFMRQIFFGIQLSQLIRHSWLFFFHLELHSRGDTPWSSQQHPFCANVYTGSIQPGLLCMCFHTFEQKKEFTHS